VASAAIVVRFAQALFVSLVLSHRLILTDREISAPASAFSIRPTVVPLSDIRGIGVKTYRGRPYLQIDDASGELRIRDLFVPDRNAFDAFAAALAQVRGKSHHAEESLRRYLER
jgi:hypothetical protein